MKDNKNKKGLNFEPPSLPSAKDRLFTTAEDWWNNACLNFAHDGWYIYAIGYKDAADILVSYIGRKRRHQDSLVYPIVFLYRQYLELALKHIIRMARILQDITEPFPQTHKIDDLWRICSRLLNDISPGDSQEEIAEIGRLISEFSKVDPISVAFRYPEDKNGNPSLPGMSRINLRNVRDVISKVAVILSGADASISEYLSIKADIEQDYGY